MHTECQRKWSNKFCSALYLEIYGSAVLKLSLMTET